MAVPIALFVVFLLASLYGFGALDRIAQRAFKKTIEAGVYDLEPLMCLALDKALRLKHINYIEYLVASIAVNLYIQKLYEITGVNSLSLRGYIDSLNRPSEHDDLVKIYLNWEDRPTTKLDK